MSTLRAASGLSVSTDALAAGREAAREVQLALGTTVPGLIVVFTTEGYEHAAVLAGVREVLGAAVPLLGCCTAGILSTRGLDAAGVGVFALAGPALHHASVAVEAGILDEPGALGERLARTMDRELADSPVQSTVLMFADCIRGDSGIDVALRSFLTVLGPNPLVVGAGAGDQLRWAGTQVFCNDRLGNDSIVAAALRTSTPIAIGLAHGCIPGARPMVVTRSEQNTVYELDGEPALDRYRASFPDDTIDMANFFPHGLLHPVGVVQLEGEYLLRTPARVLAGGALGCAGHVPERSTVMFMQHDKESLIDAARKATREALEQLDGRPIAGALVIDCVTRSVLLGERVVEEIDAIRELIGRDTPLLGLSSYGEIGGGERPTQFHNQTLLVCLLAAA